MLYTAMQSNAITSCRPSAYIPLTLNEKLKYLKKVPHFMPLQWCNSMQADDKAILVIKHLSYAAIYPITMITVRPKCFRQEA
jgi:hypothetical protein